MQPAMKIWRTASQLGGELIDATHTTQHFPRHIHDTYCLGAVVEGAQKVERGGQSWEAPQGSVIAIAPDTVHANGATSPDGWRYLMFYPNQSAVEKWLPGLKGCVLDPAEPVWYRADLCRSFLVFAETVAATEAALVCEEALRQFLRGLWRIAGRAGHSHVPAPDHPHGLSRARDYLRHHHADPLTTAELAKVAGLSEAHFVTIFRRHYGLPPHAYQTQLRIGRAKRLLQDGETIALVAQKCGFFDQSHLSRHFRRLVGTTPSAYRRGGG